MAIGLGVVLGLAALIFVFAPLFHQRQENKKSELVVTLSHEEDVVSSPDVGEQAACVALQDIELDYQLGNIEKSNYLASREEHMRQALMAFKSRSEHEQKVDQEIEEQVRRLKESYEKANM
jgi:flagellar basal body-associated protein FliL